MTFYEFIIVSQPEKAVAAKKQRYREIIKKTAPRDALGGFYV
jgi:hypothetical protein